MGIRYKGSLTSFALTDSGGLISVQTRRERIRLSEPDFGETFSLRQRPRPYRCAGDQLSECAGTDAIVSTP